MSRSPPRSKRARDREKVARYRKALRAAGLRPVQLWVADTTAHGFAAECRQQSLALRGDPAERETQEWLETVSDRTTWSA